MTTPQNTCQARDAEQKGEKGTRNKNFLSAHNTYHQTLLRAYVCQMGARQDMTSRFQTMLKRVHMARQIADFAFQLLQLLAAQLTERVLWLRTRRFSARLRFSRHLRRQLRRRHRRCRGCQAAADSAAVVGALLGGGVHAVLGGACGALARACQILEGTRVREARHAVRREGARHRARRGRRRRVAARVSLAVGGVQHQLDVLLLRETRQELSQKEATHTCHMTIQKRLVMHKQNFNRHRSVLSGA